MNNKVQKWRIEFYNGGKCIYRFFTNDWSTDENYNIVTFVSEETRVNLPIACTVIIEVDASLSIGI